MTVGSAVGCALARKETVVDRCRERKGGESAQNQGDPLVAPASELGIAAHINLYNAATKAPDYRPRCIHAAGLAFAGWVR